MYVNVLYHFSRYKIESKGWHSKTFVIPYCSVRRVAVTMLGGRNKSSRVKTYRSKHKQVHKSRCVKRDDTSKYLWSVLCLVTVVGLLGHTAKILVWVEGGREGGFGTVGKEIISTDFKKVKFFQYIYFSTCTLENLNRKKWVGLRDLWMGPTTHTVVK